jgi:hypothetical protein
MLRETRDLSGRRRDRNLPLVTLEPVEDGVYRIAEDPIDDPSRSGPDDDASNMPDDNRQVVFLDSKALFRKR